MENSTRKTENRSGTLRPFVIQADLSVGNGRFRLKPKPIFFIQSNTFFSTQLCRLSFPTGGSSRKTGLLGIQSKNLTFSTGSVSRKTQSKKFFTFFFNSSHRSSHHKTHTRTPTHPYQVPHAHTRYRTAVSYNSADAALAITAVASRRKSAWCTPSSARQQRVSHDSSSARHR